MRGISLLNLRFFPFCQTSLVESFASQDSAHDNPMDFQGIQNLAGAIHLSSFAETQDPRLSD
jgi:hypothetical protein